MTMMMMWPKDDELRLYAEACSPRFALRQQGQKGVTEFPSLVEAIDFVRRLPRERTLRLILHDDQGHRLTELVLRPC